MAVTSPTDGSFVRDDADVETDVIFRLLQALKLAIDGQRLVIALGVWQRIEPAAMLPFQLHGPWCDRILALPLNASYGIVPFSHTDWAIAARPQYDPALVRESRRKERWRRTAEEKAPWGGAIHPDWEQGFSHHKEELTGTVLPGLSFLSMETVQPDGRSVRRPRPTLGSIAVRDAPRPRLLVPSGRCDASSHSAIAALADVDILIVNLQQLRGERSSQFVRAVLVGRTFMRPTLAIAASPADVLFLAGPLLNSETRVVSIGDEPLVPAVSVRLVGRDRPQREREFEFALQAMRGESDTHDRLVSLGVAAWWAANQSLTDIPEADYFIRRFLNALRNCLKSLTTWPIGGSSSASWLHR